MRLKQLSRYILPVLACAALLGGLAIPAFAQESLGSGITQIASTQFDTAGIVAICAAVGGVALALSKFLPGYATKLNVVVVVAAGVGGAVEALGTKATIVAIIIAAIGALVGYNRSEVRAAGKSVLG